MMSTRTAAFVFSLVFSSLMAGSLHAGTFVTWDASVPGVIKGTADGVNVSVAFSPEPTSVGLATHNMSGADFDPPGSSAQRTVNVAPDIGMTWTFDQPVEDLLLYILWRGTTNGGPSDKLYTFDQTPTIQSGLTGGSISGNSLVATDTNFISGILSFPGQLSELTLEAPDAPGFGTNPYTMSFSAVPEPASAALLLGAAGTVGLWRCRRRGSAAPVKRQGSGR